MLYEQGALGEDILLAQRKLVEHGNHEGRLQPTGYFDEDTTVAVIYWQMTHLGPDGKPLGVTGFIDDATMWSFRNPSGEPQRSYLAIARVKPIVASLPNMRARVISIARGEHEAGVHEVPNGSNAGDGVDKYFEGSGLYAVPWCALFVSWVLYQAFNGWPLGARFASCYQMWKAAGRLGKTGSLPIPGDIFIMLYKNASGQLTWSGHTGIVAAVGEGAVEFNTLEGNAGNRVKLGQREVAAMYGFINPYGDKPSGYHIGLVGKAEAVESSMAGTR